MTEAQPIEPPKIFKEFAYQAWIAGKVEFSKLDIFLEAARIVGPSEVRKVIDFLEALVVSDVDDRNIQRMWSQTQTYGPGKASDARPFTRAIIDLLKTGAYPHSPLKP